MNLYGVIDCEKKIVIGFAKAETGLEACRRLDEASQHFGFEYSDTRDPVRAEYEVVELVDDAPVGEKIETLKQISKFAKKGSEPVLVERTNVLIVS